MEDDPRGSSKGRAAEFGGVDMVAVVGGSRRGAEGGVGGVGRVGTAPSVRSGEGRTVRMEEREGGNVEVGCTGLDCMTVGLYSEYIEDVVAVAIEDS